MLLLTDNREYAKAAGHTAVVETWPQRYSSPGKRKIIRSQLPIAHRTGLTETV